MRDESTTDLAMSHRVEFLASKAEVQMLLEKGYAAKTIWQSLTTSGVLTLSYSQFTRYVGKYTSWGLERRKEKANRLPETAKAEKVERKGADASTRPSSEYKRAAIPAPKPFTYNPVALSDEEIRTGIITSR